MSSGVVRTSGREFNGVLNSPCYQKGELSCLFCHSMHQSKNDLRDSTQWADGQLFCESLGNGACIQCHTEFENSGRLIAHTHHPEDWNGSVCYNCHMPHTSYGLLKAGRNHQIDSPDVRDSVTTGRPNACNLCHLDKSLGWTTDYLQKWYGIVPPELNDSEQKISAAL